MQKLNKTQKERLEFLFNSPFVNDHSKNLLRGIKGNNFKNVSIADNTALVMIFNEYRNLK